MSIEIQGPDAARAEESAPALDRDILDSLTTLIKRAGTIGQSIAAGFGIAPHDLLALFKLDDVLTMKELAQHMGCDASFVTTIADTLERHGFARREPSQRDRRVKNLVLTSEGITAKERMMAQLAAKMPWCYALNEQEQRCFLMLLRKMLDTPRLDDTEDVAEGGLATTDDHGHGAPAGQEDPTGIALGADVADR
jgi:MarR family transcriptional regulator, organic hydroperoxide resistance regulator